MLFLFFFSLITDMYKVVTVFCINLSFIAMLHKAINKTSSNEITSLDSSCRSQIQGQTICMGTNKLMVSMRQIGK